MLKQQFDDTNQAIDELERKVAKASDAGEKKCDAQIAQLRQHDSEATAKLDEFQSAAEDGWESMVDEVERLAKVFEQSFSYFKSQR